MKAQMMIKITEGIGYLFVALFVYTASSKLMNLTAFEKVLSRSPLIADFNELFAWIIPLIEILIAVLLIIPLTKRMGLYAALGLMVIFTGYLGYMVLSMAGQDLPCSCGGVISFLSWQQHVWFNLVFIGLGIIGLIGHKRRNYACDTGRRP
ncbi:MauE/DoxX family redox-associated membrane protein [Pedobacter gandavensis]|uniref:MauE/DoxX family redox-associated membrane protein n=1 Tax=Pedobacter gandavensis TaxID=2679963 RepID=UPI0024792440|nr:MauE/DoxX family redox-associated membrane protein [Pedobacter gandavensis]WGQ10437.1 MauE/DoxX family redox-associated membrane protein [Pedobacter gandavensis]